MFRNRKKPIQPGDIFGRLTVVRKITEKKHIVGWECECECGNITIVKTGWLNSGNTKSCGCTKEKHGLTGTPEFEIWQGMRRRCLDPKCKDYNNYGAKGITICEEWIDKNNGFLNFLNDMGEIPESEEKITLERIDNSLGYSKENCKWATMTEQNRNKSNVKMNMEKAEEIRQKYSTGNYTQKELGEEYGISQTHTGDIIKFKFWN